MACPKLMTASRMRKFLSCERSHFNRFHEGYDDRSEADALLFGHVLHTGLETFWYHSSGGHKKRVECALSAVANSESGLDLRVKDEEAFRQCLVLVDAYCEHYKNSYDRWDVVWVEREFLLDLVDPWWGGQYRGWQIGGKIDVGLRERSTGDFYLMDHKTTALDISDGSPYWQMLAFDPQISLYWVAAQKMGLGPVGFVYDVIAKPRLRRQRATPPSKRKYRRDGTIYKNQFEEDESLDAFTDRFKDLVNGDRNSVFVQRTIRRTDTELDVFQGEICRTIDRIESTKSANHALRNPSACYLYYRSCPYIAACGGAELARLDTVEQKQPFPELNEETNVETDDA